MGNCISKSKTEKRNSNTTTTTTTTSDEQITTTGHPPHNNVTSSAKARTTTQNIQATTSSSKPLPVSINNNNNNKEFQYWLSKVRSDPWDLQDAPFRIRNNKSIVMTAVQRNGRALEFATPQLRNNKGIVLAAVKQNGTALEFASPRLQNNTQIVLVAIKSNMFGCSFQYASEQLKQDPNFILEIVQHDTKALKFASPILLKDKEFLLLYIQKYPDITKIITYIKHVPEILRDDPDILDIVSNFTLSAVKLNGIQAIKSFPEELRNSKSVALAAVQQNAYEAYQLLSPELQSDKDIVLMYIRNCPDYIKYIPEHLKRDKDVLIAAGMYDQDHSDHKRNAKKKKKKTTTTEKVKNSKNKKKKIVLSTRFSLNETSYSAATRFTKLLKQHSFIQQGNFKIYAPNAFDKKTCDPNWTDFDHPCRGTEDTCQYNNVLTEDDGRPTDDCCWRYSFRRQLQEAKSTNGFMLQLVEKGGTGDRLYYHKIDRQELGNGQKIEENMARDLKVKIFHVYRPMNTCGNEYSFNDRHIDEVVSLVQGWYVDDDDDDNVNDCQQDNNSNNNNLSSICWTATA